MTVGINITNAFFVVKQKAPPSQYWYNLTQSSSIIFKCIIRLENPAWYSQVKERKKRHGFINLRLAKIKITLASLGAGFWAVALLSSMEEDEIEYICSMFY